MLIVFNPSVGVEAGPRAGEDFYEVLAAPMEEVSVR